MPILSLIARLGLDGRGFKAGMREASSEAGKFGKDLKRTITGGFTAGAYLEFLHSIKEGVTRVHDLSKQFELSSDQVQSLDYAMKENGQTFEDFGAALIKIGAAREAAAEGNEKLMDTFGQFGQGFAAINDPAISNFDMAIRMSKEFNGTLKQRIELGKLFGEKRGEKLMASLKEYDPNKGVNYSEQMVEEVNKGAKAFDHLTERFKAAYANMVSYAVHHPLLAAIAPKEFWKTMFAGPRPAPAKSEFVGPQIDATKRLREIKEEEDRLKATYVGGGTDKFDTDLDRSIAEKLMKLRHERENIEADVANITKPGEMFENEALKEKRKGMKSKMEDASIQLLPQNQQRDEYERRARMHLKNAQIIDDDKSPEAKRIALEEREKALDYINKFAGMNEPNQIHSDQLSRIGGFVGGGGGPQSIESQHLAVARAMLQLLKTGILIKGES